MRSLLALAAFLPLLATAAQAAPPTKSVADMAGRLMEADADNDGVVSRAEFLAWRKAQFARIDRNGDGYVTPDDVPALLAGRMGPRVAMLVQAFDTDHDGRVSAHEFIDGPSPGFDLADANHDGQVSRAEVAALRAKG